MEREVLPGGCSCVPAFSPGARKSDTLPGRLLTPCRVSGRKGEGESVFSP